MSNRQGNTMGKEDAGWLEAEAAISGLVARSGPLPAARGLIYLGPEAVNVALAKGRQPFRMGGHDYFPL